jgi:Na+/H+ antiporter NhaD/arsenite permease-like protein
MTRHVYLLVLVVFIAGSEPASAASALDGPSMTWAWSLPFAGMLLSIAAGPLLFPKVWHDHYGVIAFAWAALALACVGTFYGFSAAITVFVQSVFREYLSFILLLFALYTVAGGIVVTGRIQAGPLTNAGILALGTSLASVIGTTGSAMILVRPIIRANQFRRHQAHVIIFFIILVANIGGALTPLGDPPLFIGYLHGVDFFWTTKHLWMQTLIVAALVLAIFLTFDTWAFRNELVTPREKVNLGIRGRVNFVLIAIIIAAMLTSAAWKPGIAFDLYGSTSPSNCKTCSGMACSLWLRWHHFV